MDLVDAVLIVVGLGAILHGLRVGAVSQLCSLVGFLAGLAIGVGLVVLIDGHISDPVAKTVVAVLLLVIPATIVGNLSRVGGTIAWRALRRAGIGVIDAVLGGIVALGGTLIIAWLVASVLANSSSVALTRAVSRSVIIRGVVRVMPPVPDAFATVQRYLARNDFPEVLANVLPEQIGVAKSATPDQVGSAIAHAGASVVKVVGYGCGGEQEGSGFVTASGIVVTNAHVVAGTGSIVVYASNGQHSSALPVSFDPNLDLAVLRTAPLGEPALEVSASYVERGGPAVVLGYPGGGPFTAKAAGIASRFDAVGRNIYDSRLTTRAVYELQAVVRPGNSGGPLVLPDGEVIGVVFSRSSTNPDIGYALSSPPLLAEIDQGPRLDRSVSTEGCTS